MNLNEIVDILNSLSANYNIGNLSKIRKELKGLCRIHTSRIFNYQTIKSDYAFNVGGAREVQFNIGYEKKTKIFRYGIAFSLQQTQSLPDVSILFSKIDRFNIFLENNPANFSEMSFWYYKKGNRSDNFNVQPISNDLKCNHVFIFIGKYFAKGISEITNDDCKLMLETFDELLDLFIFVESEKVKKIFKDYSGEFIFRPGISDFQKQYFIKQALQSRTIDALHKEMQKNIYYNLIKKYGKTNVGVEIGSGYGTTIDLVVRDDSNYVFYEIKTNNSIRKCIREALPQLLEYAYYPNRNIASKLIIVSENKITDEARLYLNKLRSDFNIPIHYQRYNPKKKILEE